MAIRYEETRIGNNSIIVWLDSKIVGHIVKVDGGYQYKVKGSNISGDVYQTISEVKLSLEENDD